MSPFKHQLATSSKLFHRFRIMDLSEKPIQLRCDSSQIFCSSSKMKSVTLSLSKPTERLQIKPAITCAFTKRAWRSTRD